MTRDKDSWDKAWVKLLEVAVVIVCKFSCQTVLESCCSTLHSVLQMNVLGDIRTQVASVLSKSGHLNLDPEQLNFLWVTDFPLFTINEDTHEST